MGGVPWLVISPQVPLSRPVWEFTLPQISSLNWFIVYPDGDIAPQVPPVRHRNLMIPQWKSTWPRLYIDLPRQSSHFIFRKHLVACRTSNQFFDFAHMYDQICVGMKLFLRWECFVCRNGMAQIHVICIQFVLQEIHKNYLLYRCD